MSTSMLRNAGSSRAPRTFADLLTEDLPQTDRSQEMPVLLRSLFIPVAVVGVLVAAWAGSAPLAGAIIAPAVVKVELNRKTVQHQEGGIVSKLLVRDGQRVHAGDALIVVSDLRSNAELNVLEDQVRAERARAARAGAEAALEADFQSHEQVTGGVGSADYFARESALFVARRRTLNEEVAALESQRREIQAQAEALQLQVGASETAAKLAGDELASNEKLTRDGYVQRARIVQLQRAEAEFRSKVAEGRSNLAMARQHSAEIQARIAQARNKYQQEATDELKDATAKLRELQQRLAPSADQVDRQVVRSPVDGEVMSLRVAGAGAVVAPREPLLDVVPAAERLVVEAHIRPQDINSVHHDSAAEVRLTSFDARTTPLLRGKVTIVSGDRVTPTDGHDSYFVATVEVDAAVLESHPDIKLQAGMPAELYVATGERTLLEYLLRPLRTFSQHAMREP
jgi:HlyD family type I secretion membrane fusion protein